jgi:glycine/D-amino acid oxidase-like deaminating enzyme
MRADWDVIVIGAGLAGLAAGATATRAGAAALVLEAHVPGGRARVTTRDGFVYNRGLHALRPGGQGGGRHLAARPAVVGGAAGAILSSGGGTEQVMALTSRDGVITAIYFVGNPDKLTPAGRLPLLE